MSSTSDDATAASFEILAPPRPRWVSLVMTGLVLCVLAWAVPGIWHTRLQPQAPNAGAFFAPGSQVWLAMGDIEVQVAGGVTVTGVDDIDTAKLAGAWLLNASELGQLQDALSAWVEACETPDHMAVKETDGCRMTDDDTSALIGYLRVRGAPLDNSTALPQRLANGDKRELVTAWVAQQCGANNTEDALMVHIKRFGLSVDASVYIGHWPGCWEP